MDHRTNVILNTITLLLAIAANFWASSIGFDGITIGDISARHESLITPADYAFSIWSVIYVGLIGFVGFQWYELKKDLPIQSDIDTWLIWANVANCLWLFCWLNGYLWLSVVIIFILLDFLIRIVFKLNMEMWDAPLRVIVFLWWPITFYIGWIVLASVTNVAALLVSIGWNPMPEIMTIIMIGVTTLVYVFLTFARNMRESCLVGIWGFIAISVKHGEIYPDITLAVIIACLILFAVSFVHSYRNRYTSPFKKWQRGEL